MRLDIEPFEIRYDSEEDAWFIYGPGIMGRKKSQFYLRHQVEAEALELKAIYIAGWNDRARD
jgi:hypothetical protein